MVSLVQREITISRSSSTGRRPGSSGGKASTLRNAAPETQAPVKANGSHTGPGESWAWDLMGNDVVFAEPLYRELALHADDFVAVRELYSPSAPPAERATLIGTLEKMRRIHGPFAHEIRILKADGTIVLLKAEARIIGDVEAFESQSGSGNISESRLRLMQAASRIAERERIKLVGDIHDDPLQAMASADIRLEVLGRRIDDPEDRLLVESVQNSVRAATERLRTMLFDLAPPRLGEEGLAEALMVYAGDCFEGRVVCRVRDRLSKQPDPQTAITVFRIAQEALTNIRKHARAKKVDITFEDSEEGILVRICDDGVGFKAGKADPKHLGLQLMRERAEMAGGWLRINTAPGQGTEVDFWIKDGK